MGGHAGCGPGTGPWPHWGPSPRRVAGDNPVPVEQLGQPAQARLGVPQRYQLARPTIEIHHADRIVILGPIHTSRPCRSRRRGGLVQTHRCLSLRYQWGAPGGSGTPLPVALSGVRWRIALLPVGVSRAVGPRRTHSGPHESSELGDGPTVTGAPSPYWIEPDDGGPSRQRDPEALIILTCRRRPEHASWAWGSRRRARDLVWATLAGTVERGGVGRQYVVFRLSAVAAGVRP